MPDFTYPWGANLDYMTNPSLSAKKDTVLLLYRNSIGGILICMLASSALVFGFPNSPVYNLKLPWWFAINLLMIVRLVDSLHFKFDIEKQDVSFDASSWLKRFRLGALSTAILWGVFGLFAFGSMTNTEFIFSIIVLSALAGAAPTVLSSDRLLATSYSALLLVPISAVGLADSREMWQILGSLGMGFSLCMMFIAKKTTDFTRGAIALKHENQELLDKVSKDKRDITHKNIQLEEAYYQISKIKEGLELEVQHRTEEIVRLSKQDSLTGLFNRRAFLEELEEKMKAARQKQTALALLFLDLNGFKKVNDALGHEAGDRLLLHVADSLKTCETNTIVARWGGDEFVILAESADSNSLNESEVLQLSERLNKAIHHIALYEPRSIPINAAIGIAFYPHHATTSNDLIKMADIAMMQHKNHFRHRPAIIFQPKYLQAQERQDLLRGALSGAIRRNEFSLVFQPIYELGTQNIDSYECLLRWKYNSHMISPAEFIPLAEQSNDIVEIGEWVLNEACKLGKESTNLDGAKLSVNVSILQILDDNFVPMVEWVLRKNQFPPERLHMEITESIFCENVHKFRSKLLRLKELGVTFGLDDFGTGYSSLSQLQSLPISIVKIDKHFVENIDSEGEAVIKATNLLARELNLTVVAEGVETEHQKAQLDRLGVGFVQGFYYAKPLPMPVLSGIEHSAAEDSKRLH